MLYIIYVCNCNDVTCTSIATDLPVSAMVPSQSDAHQLGYPDPWRLPPRYSISGKASCPINKQQTYTNIKKLSWRIMNYHEESWAIMKNHDYHELFLWSEESLTTVDGPTKSKKSPILDDWNSIKNGMFWTHRTQRWCFPGKHVF